MGCSRIFLGVSSVAVLVVCVVGGAVTPAVARNANSCFAPGERGGARDDDVEIDLPCNASSDRPRYSGSPPTYLYFPSVIPPVVERHAEFLHFAPEAYLGDGRRESGVPNDGQARAGTRLSLLDHLVDFEVTDPNYSVVALTHDPANAAHLAHQLSNALGGSYIYIYVVHADPNFFNVGQSLNWIVHNHPAARQRARAAQAIARQTSIGPTIWVAVGPISSEQVREAHVATSAVNPGTDFRQQGLRVINNDRYLEGDLRYMRASSQLLTE